MAKNVITRELRKLLSFSRNGRSILNNSNVKEWIRPRLISVKKVLCYHRLEQVVV